MMIIMMISYLRKHHRHAVDWRMLYHTQRTSQLAVKWKQQILQVRQHMRLLLPQQQKKMMRITTVFVRKQCKYKLLKKSHCCRLFLLIECHTLSCRKVQIKNNVNDVKKSTPCALLMSANYFSNLTRCKKWRRLSPMN